MIGSKNPFLINNVKKDDDDDEDEEEAADQSVTSSSSGEEEDERNSSTVDAQDNARRPRNRRVSGSLGTTSGEASE